MHGFAQPIPQSPTKRRQFHRVMGGLALASVCLPTRLLHAQGSEKIRLGQSAAFSGPAAELGVQFNKGAKLFFKGLNARGGIGGRAVEIVEMDDGYEPARTTENTKKLIADGVFALFGYIGTPTTLAALPLATEARVPLWAPFTGAQGLREPFNRQVFHLRASYFDETAAIVRQATAVGISRIAVFHQNDSYGQAGLEGVRRALAADKREISATGTVERNSVDVAKAVADIMAKKPEAIVQIGAYKACAAFIREARKAGFVGTFYNVSFVGTQALANELGKDARGVVISQVMPFPFTPVTPLSGEFLKAIADEKSDIAPNYSAIEGYVAAKAFAEAATRAGRNLSRDSLISGAEAMRAVNLGGFVVDFSAQKHVGSRFVELVMLDESGRARR